MKKLTIIVIALFMISGFSAAQERAGSLSLTAGFPIPSKPEDLDTFWSNGFRGGIGYTYTIKPRLAIHGAFNYLRWALDEDAVLAGLRATALSVDESDGGTISVYDVTGTVLYSLRDKSEKFVPHLIGGAGVYFISISDADGESAIQTVFAEGIDEVKPGINLGFGADITLNEKFGLLLGAKWIMVFTKGDYRVSTTTRSKMQTDIVFRDSQTVNLSGNTHAILINLGLRFRL